MNDKTKPAGHQATLEINRVEDTNGRSIESGGRTTDETLWLFGIGLAGDSLSIKDDGKEIATAVVNNEGQWKQDIFGYSVKTLTLTVSVADGPPSEPWIVHFDAPWPVFIDSVRDSSGREIENGHEVDETAVTILGRSSPFTRVLIGPPLGGGGVMVTASEWGTWLAQMSGLASGLHVIEAKALDNLIKSERREFRVRLQSDVGIDIVRDSKRPIESGGSTFDPSLSLFGWAGYSSITSVDIYDGNDAIFRDVKVEASRWQTPPHVFSTKTHEFIVKTTDGQQASSPWFITVKESQDYVISAVNDRNGDIPDGGNTSFTNLEIVGIAPADSQTLKVYDGNDFLTDATVNGDGTWTANVSNLQIKTYEFNAKSLDGQQTSNSWRVQVRSQYVLHIQSVRGQDNVPIGNPGETRFSTLELNGQGEIGESGYIVDGSLSPPQDLFPFQADFAGRWRVQIANLESRQYVFIANSSNRQSAPWTVTVVSG